MAGLFAASAHKIRDFVAGTGEVGLLAEPAPRIGSAILLNVARLHALVAVQVLVAVLCGVAVLSTLVAAWRPASLCLVSKAIALLALPALKSLVSETVAIFALDCKALLLQMASLSAALALPALIRCMTVPLTVVAKRSFALVLDVSLLTAALARQILTVLDVMALLLAVGASLRSRESSLL
jgi:hypothetical protein